MNPPRAQKILFIDDEPSILSSFKRLFRQEGYEVFTTTDPEEVFRLVLDQSFAVVVSDQRMPVMEGVEVLTRVRELAPQTVRIMLTGYADMQAAIDAVNSGNIFRFLTKPWTDQNLKETLRHAVEQYMLVSENKRLQALTQEQNGELLKLNNELEARVQARTQEVVQLNRRLEKSFLECVKVMGGLAEYSGSMPAGHAKRVARLSGRVGKKLGLAAAECLDVQVAGFLHDIGKVGLDPDLVETHSTRGAEIVRLVPGLEKVSEIILSHHERVDGAGKPAGLKDRQIPVGSKIIAVVSEFDNQLHVGSDAVRSRPSKVLEDLRGRVGSEFSKDIFDALVAVVGEDATLGLSDDRFETEVGMYDLRPGMVTSRPIHFRDGRIALGADFALDRDILDRLWKRHLETPVVDEVFIYRSTSVPASGAPKRFSRVTRS